MLKRGADVEMRNKWGETPLHHTAARGNLESSMFLIDNGADINAVDEFGETGRVTQMLSLIDSNKCLLLLGAALHKAARFGRLLLVQTLIEKGANPTISGYCGSLDKLLITCQALLHCLS